MVLIFFFLPLQKDTTIMSLLGSFLLLSSTYCKSFTQFLWDKLSFLYWSIWYLMVSEHRDIHFQLRHDLIEASRWGLSWFTMYCDTPTSCHYRNFSPIFHSPTYFWACWRHPRISFGLAIVHHCVSTLQTQLGRPANPSLNVHFEIPLWNH